MRETNFWSACTNRAAVSITTTLYDRRALDCTSDRPLINSLNHLAYLTSTSARMRETLCVDGGLERLVSILKECLSPRPRNVSGDPDEAVLVAWKWSLALQCLLFLGTRGSERIRRRLVEAGAIPVICTILDSFLRRAEDSVFKELPGPNPSVPASAANTSTASSLVAPEWEALQSGTVEQAPKPAFDHGGALVPRDEDVVWALEILAFVSKYAYLKPYLQQTHLLPSSGNDEETMEDVYDYDSYDFACQDDVAPEYRMSPLNIFPIVERFTARKDAREIPYWAGIIMRNSCRKDESRGGIRQCANFECGKWEEYPRHFAKCRRCKRTKYCSKSCQLQAWSFHRYWCAPASSTASSSTNQSSVSVAQTAETTR